jgi:hypothetical protein
MSQLSSIVAFLLSYCNLLKHRTKGCRKYDYYRQSENDEDKVSEK